MKIHRVANTAVADPVQGVVIGVIKRRRQVTNRSAKQASCIAGATVMRPLWIASSGSRARTSGQPSEPRNAVRLLFNGMDQPAACPSEESSESTCRNRVNGFTSAAADSCSDAVAPMRPHILQRPLSFSAMAT